MIAELIPFAKKLFLQPFRRSNSLKATANWKVPWASCAQCRSSLFPERMCSSKLDRLKFFEGGFLAKIHVTLIWKRNRSTNNTKYLTIVKLFNNGPDASEWTFFQKFLWVKIWYLETFWPSSPVWHDWQWLVVSDVTAKVLVAIQSFQVAWMTVWSNSDVMGSCHVKCNFSNVSKLANDIFDSGLFMKQILFYSRHHIIFIDTHMQLLCNQNISFGTGKKKE